MSFVKIQNNHLKQQFALKSKELQKALDNPDQHIGFINLIRDVEYLALCLSANEDALNDLKQSLTLD